MAERTATILEEILAARRRQLDEVRARVPLDGVQRAAEKRTDRRNFAAALAGPGLRVIAELKRASPSRGLLCPRYRRREIARGFESAGASALSVLTEERFFLGSLDDLKEVRESVRLPVLRKDFILDTYQVFESVAGGADALLLIVRTLSDKALRELVELCDRLRVAALVEVHCEKELKRAVSAGARIIGVNNRDLKTLEVDSQTSIRLRAKIPSKCLAVSESGVRNRADLQRLAEAGFNAVLIGERLMTAPNPAKALAELLESAGELVPPRA